MTTSSAATLSDELSRRERARFWREARHGGLEFLSATFRKHRYAPHFHDTYAIGLIVAGCETFRLDGTRLYAWAGSICLVNPGAVHDGEAYGEGFRYRMTYPSVELMSGILRDATGRQRSAAPYFREPLVRDGEAAALFALAHARLETTGDRLEADEALVAAYALLLLRSAEASPPARLGREAPAIAKVRDYLDSRFAEDIELAEAAAVAGLSPFYFLRAFRRETGLTPHAFVVNRRVSAARAMLARGEAPADVALACGFFDQSHLTRVFKAHTGITPGIYRAKGGSGAAST